jgi:NADH dehydrogenase/putative oxidoreductase
MMDWSSHGAWTLRLAGWHAGVFRFIERTAWPLTDLLIRLWIAQVFVMSGLRKVANWNVALYLAHFEYPLSWLDPVVAAYSGAAIELVGGMLIALGLMTRFAAIPLLVLSLVIQFNYQALDSHLLWAALFGWYILMGAGPISLDRAMRGLAVSAVPLAPSAIRCGAWISTHLGPLYLLALRSFAAAALLWAAAATTDALPGRLQHAAVEAWLPVASAGPLAAGLALPAGVLLLAGLATRYTASLLMIVGATAGTSGAAGIYWFMLLALFALRGPGIASADGVLRQQMRRRFPRLAGKPAFALDGLPRVVIVGAGFGGLACAAALGRARVSVTIVDRANHHLFQPLLYQVATASLSPGDIAAPVRPLFRDAFNTQVRLGTVTGIDTRCRQVLLADGRLSYDYLVLATGATHSYFGQETWQVHAPGLKRIEDATEIRRRLLTAFEQAESVDDESERRALLTFLIVGGGPTGVELAGAIAELARHGMAKEFRRFDPSAARVMLVQAGPRILPAFPAKLSAIGRRSLERLGVEVLTDSRVEAIDEFGAHLNGRHIPARTVLWAAGVRASPAATWLGVTCDESGRIRVGADLAVPGLANVFAIGDTAASLAWNGTAVPGLAPAAKQGGAYVARVIRARVERRRSPSPFAYRHFGNLATIGRQSAVVDFGRIALWGAPAWWLWGLVHVGLLTGLRNRIATMVNWFWSYITLRSAFRLITGADPAATPRSPAYPQQDPPRPVRSC